MEPPEGVQAPQGTSGIVIATVFVDDILLTCSDLKAIQDHKAHLHAQFNIKDLDPLHYFLGFDIGRSNGAITMTQCKYTSELIQDSGILHSTIKHKVPQTPLPLHCKMVSSVRPALKDPEHYRSMVGKLNFLTNTRPDLSYVVYTFNQFMQTPCESHLAAVNHLLLYVYHTASQGLLLKDND
ncbi:hypothetical protein LIER_43006 [Lithospermum erythrorhizon]|uniref:Reverse transcriptase Ty1/copia-type domain-containing protein n=1 Tax=Lithospermum erythrorhizon TaxID=34254 RepID=A0AAV3PB53_LITER